MTHEKIITRPDGLRIRIIVNSIWAGKYTVRVKLNDNKTYLKHSLFWLYEITDDEILEAKLELWEKLKPIIELPNS